VAGAAAPDLRGWLAAIVGSGAAVVAFAFVAPHLVGLPELLPGVLAYACVAGEMLAVAALTPPLRPRWLLALASPLLALAAVTVARDVAPPWVCAAAVTVALLAGGTLAGAVVGRAIDDPGHLLVVAGVSALVDVYSVLHPTGPTAQLIEIEAAVNVLLLPWPILGTDVIAPVLGVGDIAFCGIYAVTTRQHGLPMGPTIAGLAVGLAATLVIVLVTGAGTPALPFMGAGVLLAQPRARALPREDRRKAALGMIALTAALAAAFLLK